MNKLTNIIQRYLIIILNWFFSQPDSEIRIEMKK